MTGVTEQIMLRTLQQLSVTTKESSFAGSIKPLRALTSRDNSPMIREERSTAQTCLHMKLDRISGGEMKTERIENDEPKSRPSCSR